MHNDPTGHCFDGISTAICIGAAIGTVVSVASYVAVTHATGGEVTAGGIAGAAIGGAIGGAVSVIAAPLAGTIMTAAGISATAESVAVGAALVNATAGAAGYLVGGETTNLVDTMQGKDPEFQPTLTGTVATAGTAGLLAYGAGKLLPVSSGQYSLAQAAYFLPGKTVQSALLNPNAVSQNLQVVTTTAIGTGIGIGISEVSEKDKQQQPPQNANPYFNQWRRTMRYQIK